MLPTKLICPWISIAYFSLYFYRMLQPRFCFRRWRIKSKDLVAYWEVNTCFVCWWVRNNRKYFTKDHYKYQNKFGRRRLIFSEWAELGKCRICANLARAQVEGKILYKCVCFLRMANKNMKYDPFWLFYLASYMLKLVEY